MTAETAAAPSYVPVCRKGTVYLLKRWGSRRYLLNQRDERAYIEKAADILFRDARTKSIPGHAFRIKEPFLGHHAETGLPLAVEERIWARVAELREAHRIEKEAAAAAAKGETPTAADVTAPDYETSAGGGKIPEAGRVGTLILKGEDLDGVYFDAEVYAVEDYTQQYHVGSIRLSRTTLSPDYGYIRGLVYVDGRTQECYREPSELGTPEHAAYVVAFTYLLRWAEDHKYEPLPFRLVAEPSLYVSTKAVDRSGY